MPKISIDDCVNIIVTNQDVLPVYEYFADLFNESKMHKEEAEIYEKIYNLTHNSEILLKIAAIFNDNLDSAESVLTIYEKYLYNVMPDFYKTYNETLEKCGRVQLNGEDIAHDSEVLDFTDRCLALLNLMAYLFEQNDYDRILIILKKLAVFKKRFDDFRVEKTEDDKRLLENIKIAERSLSKKIVDNTHNNCINWVAIALDEDNIKAYLNIIEEMINNGNVYEALKFFNEEFAVKFRVPKQSSPSGVCWFISDKYKHEQDYYKCIILQQKAVSMEPRYEY